ncbi:secretin [Robbsia andropogonis]|uniref:Type 3 secretion system secretin n=1 Tax=Robbsia andropogonis TaxID=28092 RepID=A0A0F5JY61_9BURK|nr:secretin [Robbsia andropogonis]
MHTMKSLVTLLLCAVALFAMSVAPVDAAQVQWRSAQIDYTADAKDVKDVLHDFAASQGIPANISQSVSGNVTGKFQMSPQRFLDTLASTFGFVWYYDGQVLDVVTPDAMKSQLIRLDHASAEDLRETLREMHVSDPRFSITYDSAQGAAIVSGPPNYVKLVSDIAERLDSNTEHRAGTVVKVFPLYHAWAMDRTTDADGTTINLPGVATVLNSMYHPNENNAGASSANKAATSMTNVKKVSPMNNINGYPGGQGSNSVAPPIPSSVQGQMAGFGNSQPGLLAGLSGQASPQLQSPSSSGDNQQGGGRQKDQSLPVIVADQRTNSVLIRDTPDRMDQYPALIERLDIKPQLVEIQAQIFEVDDSVIDQLGINWTAHNGHVDLQTGNGLTAQNTYNGTLSQNFGTTTLAGGATAAAAPAGAALTTVIGGAGRYLMANVAALAETNKAKIDASPKVATLNDIEADMANQTQFFVRVSGYTSADLYSVSTGVSLRVLPMVVDEDGKRQIKLDVSIQDGQLSGQTVDNIPVITSSNINTSAFINEGEALLVAGYKVDKMTRDRTGVPGLSKIPVIGGLFRYHDNEDSHMERLFLLTPKVIDL